MDGVLEHLKTRDLELQNRINLLDAKCAILESKIETLEVKNAALERAADAHRKHLGNLESKLARSNNGLKGFRE